MSICIDCEQIPAEIRHESYASTTTTTTTTALTTANADDDEEDEDDDVCCNSDDHNDDEGKECPPEAKFQPLQKIYARDNDGVVYPAVVRRRLFGPQYHRTFEIGLVTSKEEEAELLKEDLEPKWHYFVHYCKWNVNFDRWLPEECVMEMTDENRFLSEKLLSEHRALQKEMQRASKGKRKNVDGTTFLREWRKRKDQVERQHMLIRSLKTDKHIHNSVPSNKNSKGGADPMVTKGNDETIGNIGPWTKATLSTEFKLREKSLTTKQPQTCLSSIVLPFALKKSLVEQWEIISQCGMMPCVPTTVTIRQALDKYLESKGVVPSPSTNIASEITEASSLSSSLKEVRTDTETITREEIMSQKESPIEHELPRLVKRLPVNDRTEPFQENDSQSIAGLNPSNAEYQVREEELRDMTNGIAMLFDEALASHLLYREEMPQLRALENMPEYSEREFSELYGCEHLLRLLIRLPEMLADQLNEDEVRPIVAKVNDFVRFLHKNHGTLFTQSHRKLNEVELKEKEKLLRMEERKRKKFHDKVSEGVP